MAHRTRNPTGIAQLRITVIPVTVSNAVSVGPARAVQIIAHAPDDSPAHIPSSIPVGRLSGAGRRMGSRGIHLVPVLSWVNFRLPGGGAQFPLSR
jgi:hypothetical protein